MKRIPYNENNREQLLIEIAAKGESVIEDQIYLEGNYFVVAPPGYIAPLTPKYRDLEKEIDDLETRLAVIEDKTR